MMFIMRDEGLKMQESTEVPLFKICPFDEALNVSKSYICYRNEVCCAQGCCSMFSYKYFQNWHFWLSALVIFVIFYTIGRYCKKLERQRVIREECNNVRNVNPSQYASTPISDMSPHSSLDEGNVNNLLEHFFQNYSNRSRCHQCPALKSPPYGEPPPGYNIALNMPKPDDKDCDDNKSCDKASTKDTSSTSRSSTKEEAAPSYEAATGKKDNKEDSKKPDKK